MTRTSRTSRFCAQGSGGARQQERRGEAGANGARHFAFRLCGGEAPRGSVDKRCHELPPDYVGAVRYPPRTAQIGYSAGRCVCMSDYCRASPHSRDSLAVIVFSQNKKRCKINCLKATSHFGRRISACLADTLPSELWRQGHKLVADNPCRRWPVENDSLISGRTEAARGR